MQQKRAKSVEEAAAEVRKEIAKAELHEKFESAIALLKGMK